MEETPDLSRSRMGTVSPSYRDFLASHETAHPFDFNDRLQIFADVYRRHRLAAHRSLDILDIGCGRTPQLLSSIDANDRYTGVDFYDAESVSMPRYRQVDLNAASLSSVIDDERYDVIFCGEVLEHLFAPDALLEDVHGALQDDGIAVISTPNLAYWRNRVLLLFGISPLYLENAAEMKLGRRFRALGQGNKTEGHVKVFTYRALRDLLALKRFEILTVLPTVTWPNRLDVIAGRLSRSLAANNVVVARRQR
jgi:SAM-dependent methyltransferase